MLLQVILEGIGLVCVYALNGAKASFRAFGSCWSYCLL